MFKGSRGEGIVYPSSTCGHHAILAHVAESKAGLVVSRSWSVFSMKHMLNRQQRYGVL